MRYTLRIIFLLLVSFVFIMGPASSLKAEEADSVRVQALLAEGDVFYRRLDNRLAITTYRKAYEIDSTSYPVLSRLARTASDLGRDLSADNQNSEAEEIFLEALRYAESLENMHGQAAKTHYFLALAKGNLALLKGGKQKVEYGRDVERHCQKGLSLDSTDAEILVAYGVFNREAASSSWMERMLAQTLFGRVPEGTRENSVQLLRKAVEIDPNLHVAQFELALSLIAIGRPDEAMHHLKVAESLPAQTTQDNRNRQLAMRMLERMSQ